MNRDASKRSAIGLSLLLALIVLLFVLRIERDTRPKPLPDFTSVRERYRSSEAQLLDRNGVLLQSQRLDLSQRRLGWVTLNVTESGETKSRHATPG